MRIVLALGRHGQIGHVQAVIVTPPFALLEHRMGDFLDRQVFEGIGIGVERLAAHQQGAIRPHVFSDLGQRLVSQILRCDEDEIGLGRIAVIPVFIRVPAWRIGEAHMLAHGFGQHLGL